MKGWKETDRAKAGGTTENKQTHKPKHRYELVRTKAVSFKLPGALRQTEPTPCLYKRPAAE